MTDDKEEEWKKKSKKKKDKTPLEPPKLQNADDNTIVAHGNYSALQLYAHEVQYYNKSQPKYTPFELKDKFLPKFTLPHCVISSVDAICILSLPDSFLDGNDTTRHPLLLYLLLLYGKVYVGLGQQLFSNTLCPSRFCY